MSAWEALLNVVFPPSCVACDAVLVARQFFCEGCEPLVLSIGPVHCSRCAEPGLFRGGLCPRCVKHRPAFTRAFAPFELDGAVARAVHRFKYEDRPELSGTLGRLLSLESKAFLSTAPVNVCPIPVHGARYRKRRYDQATLLAVELCVADTRFTLRDEILTRTKATQRQVGLSDEKRIENVSQAFVASSPPGEVLLIDDVLTTGATADAAAKALRRAGAKRVEVLALARARRLLP
jgi:ComF family protein